MDLWKLVWMIALIGGIAGFGYISLTVIIRGFAEVRSLFQETLKK